MHNTSTQIRLRVTSPEQEAYELLRPIVLFGQPPAARARETGVPERTLRRKATRFDALGMRSRVDQEPPPAATDRRRSPPELRQTMLGIQGGVSRVWTPRVARICRERFDRPVSHHAVERVLLWETLPIPPPRRFRRYHEIADPVERRRAVVTLYLDGWSVKAIAGYLDVSRPTVYDVLHRWTAKGPGQGWRIAPGRRSTRPAAGEPQGDGRHPPAAGQPPTGRVPNPCGAAPTGAAPLAPHLRPDPGAAPRPGSPQPAAARSHEPQPMPFAAVRRHQYWSVDIRYVEEHRLGTGKPVYVISGPGTSAAPCSPAPSPRGRT